MLKLEITNFSGTGVPTVVTPDKDDPVRLAEPEDRRPRPILRLVKQDD
jgi:hypothetical protein